MIDALYLARRAGVAAGRRRVGAQRTAVEFLETRWREPDEGIWEVRGPRRHFTHSKVMAWVAVRPRDQDRRGARARRARSTAGARCATRSTTRSARAGSTRRGAFTQYYGSNELDASLLMIPLVGFLPPDDPRVAGDDRGDRARAAGRRLRAPLSRDRAPRGRRPAAGRRRVPAVHVSGSRQLRAGRAARRSARSCSSGCSSLRNDVGLLSEEYDPAARRLLGNFPQAFSHVALINTALNLTRQVAPAHDGERRTGGVRGFGRGGCQSAKVPRVPKCQRCQGAESAMGANGASVRAGSRKLIADS